ncbi:hypothetical protein [Luteolibacter marinus]|uniref:hypothetical protein n=1 Tax=Luteolibacter marinus TaxID=2776705 RepID=UPI001D0152C5|nr:hypothetical protein [Luteolibacter marinus]
MLLLLVCLVISLAFAGWEWLRPYESGSDPAARFRIAHASVTRDHRNLWLDLYLKHTGGEPHDLGKPVDLQLADGRSIEPAGTTLEGETGTTAIGFRFWLDEADFSGPMSLRINDGTLSVRSGSGVPDGGDGSPRFFTTRNW